MFGQKLCRPQHPQVLSCGKETETDAKTENDKETKASTKSKTKTENLGSQCLESALKMAQTVRRQTSESRDIWIFGGLNVRGLPHVCPPVGHIGDGECGNFLDAPVPQVHRKKIGWMSSLTI